MAGKKNARVMFVVLNFNGWKETISCIESILEQTYQDFHIFLVDNGSSDESLRKLAKFYTHKKITVFEQPINLGFAGGVNIGIKEAIRQGYMYTALLNNDAVISPNWLSVLLKTAKATHASTITGLLLSLDGKKIDNSGDSYSNWGLPFPRQRNEPAIKARSSGYVFSGTAGASLYITELFSDIGLFDEAFFAYFEDADIGFRAQLAGHKAYYEKSAVAYHNHGTTSSKMPGFTVYQTFKNLPQVIVKNMPFRMLFPCFVRFFIWYFFIYIRSLFNGNFIPATSGILRSWLIFPRSVILRQNIQRNKRVAPAYVKQVIHRGMPPNTRTALAKLLRR